MRKCQYCVCEEICGIGENNIPVCLKHFEEYLIGKRLEIDNAVVRVKEANDVKTTE